MLYSDRRAEVYLRTDTIGTYEAQKRVLNRLNRLDEQDVFDQAEVAATWDGIETHAGDTRTEAVETYREFQDWADANDFSLEPAFDVRERYVTGTTERREAVIFPVVAMAIYVGDDLQAVLPATDEYGHYTVHEAIEGFERGDLDRWLSRFRGVFVDRTEPRLEASSDL